MSPSVTILEGQTSATFNIAVSSVSVSQTAHIQAFAAGTALQSSVMVKPWLGSLRLNPGSVTGGQTATGTLTLNLPAPSGGLSVSLVSSDPALTFPNGATLTMAAGTTTQNFTVKVGSVAAAKSATVTASYLAETQTASVYLNPAGVQAQSVSVAPGSVVGGNVATGVVTLNGSAPSGGSLVALSSADIATAMVPASVLVPAGQTSAAFTIKTNPTGTLKSVIISATLGVTQITTLSVRGPGIASLTLIPASIIGGSTSIGIVTLEAPATAPLTIAISSNQSAATPAASVIIPVGQTTGNFTIATSIVTSPVTALLTAKANGTARSQGLSLYPVGTKLAIATLSGVLTLEGCVNPAQLVTFVLRPADGTAAQTLTTTLGSDGSFAFSAILTQKIQRVDQRREVAGKSGCGGRFGGRGVGHYGAASGRGRGTIATAWTRRISGFWSARTTVRLPFPVPATMRTRTSTATAMWTPTTSACSSETTTQRETGSHKNKQDGQDKNAMGQDF